MQADVRIHRLFKPASLCNIPMKMPAALFLTLCVAPAIGSAAVTVASAEPAPPPQRRGDQVEAFEARRQGKILPLREIERRIVPQMRGAQYLGVELESYSGIYTLKFLRDGTVIWVEVDGASGRIIGRTGN